MSIISIIITVLIAVLTIISVIYLIAQPDQIGKVIYNSLALFFGITGFVLTIYTSIISIESISIDLSNDKKKIKRKNIIVTILLIVPIIVFIILILIK